MGLTVKLSAERGDQLREYASQHGLGFGEAIGKLLSSAGAAKVPGLDCRQITAIGTVFSVRIDAVYLPLSRDQVRLVADVIEGSFEPKSVGRRALIGEREVIVCRARGNASIIITAHDKIAGTDARRILPIDIARDFVEQLRRAVKPH